MGGVSYRSSLTVLGWHVDNHRESIVDKRVERLVPNVHTYSYSKAHIAHTYFRKGNAGRCDSWVGRDENSLFTRAGAMNWYAHECPPREVRDRFELVVDEELRR